MTDRPPRPDEDDLARFHNGDTLDNIPIVPSDATAQPIRPHRSWAKAGVLTLAAGVGVAAVGGLVGAGVARFVAGPERPAAAATPSARVSTHTAAPLPASSSPKRTPAPSSAGAVPPSVPPQPSPPPPSPVPTPTYSPSPEITTQSGLEQVQVIQAPPTGGDPEVSYCLVYTGTWSGDTRDAILLANAPAYQCTDLIDYVDTAAPDCIAPSRAAVVAFAEGPGWAGDVVFACLTRHTGT